MGRLLLLAMLSTAVTLPAQDHTPQKNNPTPDPASAPCTVAGRVIAAADGNPLKSARVTLIPEHSRTENQIYSATSDSDANFTIKNIPPGRYRFFAAHTGFVEQHYKATNNETGPIFSLHPGEKVTDVRFRLTAAGVITGRITDEDGDPMQRVQVVALRRPTEEETEDALVPHKIQVEAVASAQSDDRGQYRIFGLKPGEYYVRAEDALQPPAGRIPLDENFWAQYSLGSDYGSVYYPGANQVSQAQVIPLKAGEEAQADMVMRHVKTVEIAGHVIGSSGPVVHALVRLEMADATDSEFDRQDTTDEKGAFRLRNVPEGTYYVAVEQRDPGSRVYESRAWQKIEVAGENMDSLTITIGIGAMMQGRVKLDGGSSVALDRVGVALISMREETVLGGHTELKKDGSFDMKSVPDGNYSFLVSGLDRAAYVKSIRCGPDDVLEKGVQVEAGVSPGRIEVTIGSDGAQLDGSIADDDGAVIGARVRLVPEPLTPYNHLRIQHTTSDQLGHFSLSAIAPGRYTLTAKSTASSESHPNKSDPQDLTFSANDHRTIELKIEKPQE